jgi:hypothetical protein
LELDGLLCAGDADERYEDDECSERGGTRYGQEPQFNTGGFELSWRAA